ncbi:MAG: hypothetical protein CVV27_08700, partial [Candidatus Melainabacteria bacterium HGW-Melainabacteria-1]
EGISLTNAERGLIVLTDGKAQIQWKYATTYRIDRDLAEAGKADISQSILQDALSRRETVVRFGEPQQATEAISDSMMSLKIYSAMCAPLLLHERIIGLFYVDARQLMNNFTEVDQFLFDYLADHAAIAIFNAKRYADLQAENQRQRQSLLELEALHEQLEARHHKLLEQAGRQTSRAREPISHTYSAGGIVLNLAGEVLLTQSATGDWSLPRGPIEAGEEPAVLAQRRVAEASGISYLHLVQSLGSYHRLSSESPDQPREMQTVYMYLFHTEQEPSETLGAEQPNVRWAPPDQVPSLLSHPKDKDFFQGALTEEPLSLKRAQPDLS